MLRYYILSATVYRLYNNAFHPSLFQLYHGTNFMSDKIENQRFNEYYYGSQLVEGLLNLYVSKLWLGTFYWSVCCQARKVSDDVYVCLKYYVDFVSTIVWSDTVFRCSVGYCVPMFGRILCSDVPSDTVFRQCGFCFVLFLHFNNILLFCHYESDGNII